MSRAQNVDERSSVFGFEAVPASWKIRRGDTVVSTSRRLVSPEQLAGRVVFHYSIPSVQTYGTGQLEDGKTIDSAKFLITEPALLVSKLNPRKATMCMALPQEQITVCSTEFVQMIVKDVDQRYFHYIMQSEVTRSRLSSLVASVTRSHQRVQPADILKFIWAYPERGEQRTIADFLDHETAQVDALIGKQNALLDLLSERRKAVITRAVTKGLHSGEAMRESGSQWVGQIPEVWAMKRLSWLFSDIGSGTTPPNEDLLTEGGDYCWVTTGELRETVILGTSKMVSKQTLASTSALRLFQPGTLLIAMYGATIGRLGTLGVEACTNQACCALGAPNEASPRFVFYALQAALEHLLLLASGGGQPNINQEKLRSLRLPTPPLSTQIQIADYLDNELAEMDAVTGRAQRFIALLQERRSAVITAAVTGKMDVWGAA